MVNWVGTQLASVTKKARKQTVEPTVANSAFLVECASLKFIINDGRLEVINGGVFQLPDNTVVSSGFVDLHTETLGFVFRTKRKKLIDWSALSLVKFIEIGGELSQPSITLDRRALVEQGLLSTTSMMVGSLPPLVYSLAKAGLKNRQEILCVPELVLPRLVPKQ